MAESKHTPGPWELEYGHDQKFGPRYWQVHDGQHAICNNQFCWAPNSDANARLIAAAPDLLEALRLYETYAGLPQLRDGPNGQKATALKAFIAAKDAAIAKATTP